MENNTDNIDLALYYYKDTEKFFLTSEIKPNKSKIIRFMSNVKNLSEKISKYKMVGCELQYNFKEDIVVVYLSKEIRVMSAKQIAFMGENVFYEVRAKEIVFEKTEFSWTTTTKAMFYHCDLEKLDLSGIDFKNVTIAADMFSTVNIDTLNLQDTKFNNVSTISGMFGNSLISKLNTHGMRTTNKLKAMYAIFVNSMIDEIDFTDVNMEGIETLNNTFESAAIGIVRFGKKELSNINETNRTFKNAYIDNIDLENVEFNNVAIAREMFAGSTMKYIELNFNKSPLKECNQIFNDCSIDKLEINYDENRCDFGSFFMIGDSSKIESLVINGKAVR